MVVNDIENHGDSGVVESLYDLRELAVLRGPLRVRCVAARRREPPNRHIAPLVVCPVLGCELLYGLELHAVNPRPSNIAIRGFQPFCKPRKSKALVGRQVRRRLCENVAQMYFHNGQIVPFRRIEMLWGVRNAVVVFYDSRARRRFKGVCVWIDNICAHVKMRGGKPVVAVKVDCRLRNPHRPVVRLGLYQKAVFASLSPVPYIRGLRPRREYRKLRAAVAAVGAEPF